jgi:peptidyl-prolyl cis-trans isomerase B (cyclophilin B)
VAGRRSARPRTRACYSPATLAYPTCTVETDHGTFELELWNDVAPGHAENFLKLAGKGFYDGLSFHRIIPGFVIQGGCPKGDGTGGPGWNIKAEFNDRQHVPGVLSMARSGHPDSAGSQFFVCLTREQCQHLDRQYTAFGKVTKGMDVVEKIAATPLRDPRGGTPAKAPRMTKVTVNANQPAGR